MKLKFQKEDVLLAIQSVQYELNKAGENRKPYIKEVAERLNTYDDMAIFYIDKYGYRDKMDILPKGKCNREITKNKGKALEEIKSELHELNENIKQQNIFNNNISKSLYILARLNLKKYKNENEVDITTDALYIDSHEVLLTIEDEIFKNI